jgi:hypothetical protein
MATIHTRLKNLAFTENEFETSKKMMVSELEELNNFVSNNLRQIKVKNNETSSLYELVTKVFGENIKVRFDENEDDRTIEVDFDTPSNKTLLRFVFKVNGDLMIKALSGIEIEKGDFYKLSETIKELLTQFTTENYNKFLIKE